MRVQIPSGMPIKIQQDSSTFALHSWVRSGHESAPILHTKKRSRSQRFARRSCLSILALLVVLSARFRWKDERQDRRLRGVLAGVTA
jgi:hypothetical protein